MEKRKNLEELTKEISDLLYDSMNLLEILEDVVEGQKKEDFLVSSIYKNTYNAFNYVEECRELISVPDI